jgi:predicted TIM-barrel fold metal-dependent hydrolase
MIVDAHAHLGDCRVFDLNVTEDDLLRSMDANRVDASVVQPFPGASDAAAVHKRIRQLAARQPGRIYGMASVNPHRPKQEYVDEVTRWARPPSGSSSSGLADAGAGREPAPPARGWLPGSVR